MKLMIHELEAAMESIRTGDLPAAFKMLSRFSKIQSLNHPILGCVVHVDTVRIYEVSRLFGTCFRFSILSIPDD